jgi:dTDP-glucose 4,6-dehydratase
VPLIVVNAMNLIGEMQHRRKFVPATLARVLAGEKVPIHSSPDGRVGSRFYLHARNLADALLFMLRRVPPVHYARGFDEPRRFHVVGEREIDNLELAQLIASYAGRPLQYRLVDFHSSRPGHDLRYALDGSRLAALGWRPPMALEESLRRTVRWTLEHPEWLLDETAVASFG